MLYTTSPELSTIFNVISWTLLHSIWQTALLYFLLKIILRIIPENKSVARYYTTLSFLGISILWFALTLSKEYTSITYITYQIPENGTGISRSDILGNIIAWYNNNSIVVAGAYFIILTIMLIRLVVNISLLQKLRNNNIAPLDTNWENIFTECYQRMRINKNTIAKFSSKVAVPMTMGVIKPIVLIPIALCNKLSTEEIEAILLHELAHIKRNDYLVNLLQVLTETVLFYNPFVWLISNEIRKEREHCCDDTVIKHTNNKLPYAKALTALESFRVYPNEPALAATGSKNHLFNRIKRIMELKNKRINYSQLTIVLVMVMLLITGAFLVVPKVTAQEKGDKKKKQVVLTEKKGSENNDKKDDKEKSNAKATIIIKHKSDDGKTTEEIIEIEEQALRTAATAIKTAADAIEAVDVSAVVKKAMSEIDWDEIDHDISKALDEINIKELKAEIEKELKEGDIYYKGTGVRIAKLDTGKMLIVTRKEQKELLEAQKELEEAKKRLIAAKKNYAIATSSINRSPGKSVVTAHKRKGSTVFTSHDILLNTLEKDGLIDKSRSYYIKKSDGALYIDGKKQHTSIYKKYEHLMPDDQMIIKGTKKSISITTEN